MKKEFLEMKKSVKSIVSLVSALAMVSTSAMAVSAAAVTTVDKTDYASVSAGQDLSKIDADVLLVQSATKKMEEAALVLLKDTFGAEKATKNSIMNAAAAMDADELKAAVESTTAAMEANEALKAAVEEAVAEVEEIAKAAADKDAALVITSVYNPFDGFTSSPVVDAAKAAAQVYVDEVNAKIAVIAKDAGAQIAEVEAPKDVVSVEDIKNNKVSIADAMTEVAESQKEAKNDSLTKIEVEAEEFVAPEQWGDFNGDGEVKAVDLVIMLQGNLGILSEADFEAKGYDLGAADVDRDGVKFSDGDIAMVKKVLLEDLNKSDLGRLV
jgi:hypothetical protein